jgi:hypothetical protein
MGVSYVVIAIDGQVADWLRGFDIDTPSGPSRLPSPNEIRTELARLDDWRVRWRENQAGGWDAEVVDAVHGYQGRSTTIWITDIKDPDAPHDFSFHKGDAELAALIVERLTHTCGPLVLIRDHDAQPALVVPGADPAAVAARLG